MKSFTTLAIATLQTLIIVSLSYAQNLNYGAVAYSPKTGAYGYSYDHTARNFAEHEALIQCQKNAADCRIVASYFNSCASIARGELGGWGVARASTERRAKQIAINNCRKYDKKCKTRVWSCTTR